MAFHSGRAFTVLTFLFALFLTVPAPRAEEPEDAEKKGDSLASIKAIHSVPYPNGSLYVGHGISGTFMGGKHRNLGENENLFQWQGELTYFYTQSFSGGFGFKITAGEPSDKQQKIFNRYFAHVRFHKTWKTVSLYVGPQVGVGNLNLLTDSSSDTAHSTIKTPKGLPIEIGNTKPTLAIDLGGGWMFSRYVGLTLGNHIEYSLVDEEGVGVTNALNLHVSPGLSVDVLAFIPKLRSLVSALYVSAEVQSGYLIFEKSNKRQDRAGVLGLGLAF